MRKRSWRRTLVAEKLCRRCDDCQLEAELLLLLFLLLDVDYFVLASKTIDSGRLDLAVEGIGQLRIQALSASDMMDMMARCPWREKKSAQDDGSNETDRMILAGLLLLHGG